MTGAEAGFLIFLAPVFLEAGARKMIEKLASRHRGDVFLDVVLLELPGDFGGARDQLADVVAIGADGLVEVAEDGFERDRRRCLEKRAPAEA